MSFQPELQSPEMILGDLIREVLINTDLNDVAPGSSLGTMLEGIANAIYQVSVTALKILEASNLESLSGTDLDKRAASIKLPNTVGGIGRKPASQSSGNVTIGSAFEKISSKQYAGKPAPFAGSLKIFLENAEDFPTTGSVYLARGTVDRFEGPIPYSSVTNTGSYWEMVLTSPLTKSHLASDLIVVAQGGDRIVAAGTSVRTRGSSTVPAVEFKVTSQITIPDGESEGTASVVCTQFGEVGNVLAGAITEFGTAPFSGATVTNGNSFINGKSSENDEDLRIRIKNYPHTLSRGTATAIRSAILGATDPETGRTIQSAIVLEPVEPGDSARVFIDDGTGLEPSFDGQEYELLLQSASGQESRFRTAQFPVTPATAIGANSGPFAITNTMSITVIVDDVVETYFITASNYQNLNSVTAYELARDFNSQSNIVGFRTMDEGKRLIISDLSGEAELLQIAIGDLQEILGLPTADIRQIFLYQNSELQSFRGQTATLETRARNLWSLTSSDLEDVRIEVDGVIQTITITDADFSEFSATIATATVTQWAEILATKIAGVKFTVSGQRIIYSTWQAFSPSGSLRILETREDGSLAGWIGSSKMWTPESDGGVLSDVGHEKDFKFNRLTGEINFVIKPPVGATIEIGSRSTRAFVPSIEAVSGLFATAPLPLTVNNSRFVVGFDGEFIIREVSIAPGTTVTPTDETSLNSADIVRLTANAAEVFVNAEVGDFMYLVQDVTEVPAWGVAVEGIYRIKAKGNSLYATDQVYSTLSAYVTGILTPAIETFRDSDVVRVTHTSHGLKTGDIINVSTSTAVGGISGLDLSVMTDIIVIDANRYTYVAAAAATSDDTGTIDAYIGYNTVTVTHPAHGFETGATITVVTAAAIGGILGAQLSTTAQIEVIDADTYVYRVATASTTGIPVLGVLASVTYVADVWVEFEISQDQYTDWSAIFTAAQSLSANMMHIFKSTVIPQIVDLGSGATITADEFVSTVNEQISSGKAEKINPKQVLIRSNNYVDGSAAVLAVIGNASTIFEEPTTSESIQAHTANAPSSYSASGFPVVTDIETPTTALAGFATRTYLKVDRDQIRILDVNTNPTIDAAVAWVSAYPEGFESVWVTGKQYGLVARVYNNQTTAPYTGILRGEDTIRPLQTSDDLQTSPASLDRYGNYSLRVQDLPFNNYDKFVVEMDLDPIDKTVAINFFKLAKILDIDAITGSGKGQVISFRLKDPEDADKAFFASDSAYKDFNFEDFKMLTRSVGLYREDLSDRALIIRSHFFGSPAQFNFSIQLPEAPDAILTISHINDFDSGYARTTVIAALGSGSLIAGSTLSVGDYRVTPTASGTIYSLRISSGSLNSGNEYQPGNVLNIAGGVFGGSYQITNEDNFSIASASASVSIGLNTVTVTAVAHGLINGDLISVSTGAAIGGITAAQLSQSDTPITYIDANTFSYEAAGTATVSTSGILTSVISGAVTVLAPGNAGVSTYLLLSAAQYPIRSWTFLNTSYVDVETALNAYLPDNPVVIAEAIGTNPSTNYFLYPTYRSNPAATSSTGEMVDAFLHHTFQTKFSGSAGIWQYDSSVPSANNIKATVQTDDSIFPTTTDASGTTYTPIDEEVVLVPTNTSTLTRWLNFNAASSLNLLARIEKINSDSQMQIASQADGELGAIRVTGVFANEINASVIGNGTEDGDSTKVRILSSNAKPILRNSIMRVQNQIRSELARPYRLTPTGASVTAANTTDISTFFRPTTAVKYIRVDQVTGRVIFYRNGMGPSQTEPLAGSTGITLTSLGGGLVQVTTVGGSSVLSARVGDLMYIQPESDFPIDARCKKITGMTTDPTAPEYIGYPVVHVIDTTNIVILASNIVSFGLTVPLTNTDVVFMPGIWNEKNIRTNHQSGALFDAPYNSAQMYILVKALGNGFTSVWVQNSSAEATDDMLLDELSVSTDDFAIFSDGFDPANQGTFRIIAHNGRNHLIVYNPSGGKDEIIDMDTVTNGGIGERNWRVGPLQDALDRALRIIDSESIKIGDFFRISSPSASGQWFPSTMFGSWEITGIGYQAVDYTGFPLPHDTSDGVLDYAMICPYIEFSMPEAPISIQDSNGDDVDAFVIGSNAPSLGFVEGTAFDVFRTVAGHGISPIDDEEAELYLLPNKSSSKMTSTFGTVVSSPFKLNFDDKTFTGVDGYKIFSGPIQLAHRIIDGLPTNTTLYQGVKAVGTQIQVLPPLFKAIQLELQIRPKDGVTLNSLTDLVKSTAEKYISNLGVGQPVVLSALIRVIQGLPGVFSTTILSTLPVATDDRIVVGESERAIIIDITRDISVG